MRGRLRFGLTATGPASGLGVEALIAGKTVVIAHLGMELFFGAADPAAGSTIVAANLSQRIVTLNLQHLWLFNQGSGQVLTDFVGSSHGQLGSGAGSDANDPSWVPEGLEWDNVQQYVTFPNFQDPSAGPWTIMIAFRSDADTKTILSLTGVNNRADWLAHTSAGSFNSGLGGSLVDGGISNGVWYLGIMRFTPTSGTTGTLFLTLRRTGSSPSASATRTMPTIPDGTHVLGVSSFQFPPGTFTFDGMMALMAHYNRALSDAEITTMFDYAKAYLAGRGISL
jgi:hypothetical protein